jgi:DNA-binding CsgD family transcriptional regulator
VHALTTLGALEMYPVTGDPWTKLQEALSRAKAANLHEDAARILINVVEGARDLNQYDRAERAISETIALLEDHELGLYQDFLRSRIAQIDLERGRWSAAARVANAILEEPGRSNLVRSRALEVVGRLRGRRGEPGAMAALDSALALTGPGELQELVPLHAARAEIAWLAGDVARCGDEAMRSVELAGATGAPFWYSESSFWAWRAGRRPDLPDGTDEPFILHAAGRHRDAAAGWAVIGLPYLEASALADSDDEADLRAALSILHGLGATVLANRVSATLRERGAERIPRGPRPATRAHAAGLTAREVEVLQLMRRGSRNAEIAAALVLSEKTVDHHVSAILRKLGVPDRDAARREAERLGFEDGSRAAPD